MWKNSQSHTRAYFLRRNQPKLNSKLHPINYVDRLRPMPFLDQNPPIKTTSHIDETSITVRNHRDLYSIKKNIYIKRKLKKFYTSHPPQVSIIQPSALSLVCLRRGIGAALMQRYNKPKTYPGSRGWTIMRRPDWELSVRPSVRPSAGLVQRRRNRESAPAMAMPVPGWVQQYNNTGPAELPDINVSAEWLSFSSPVRDVVRATSSSSGSTSFSRDSGRPLSSSLRLAGYLIVDWLSFDI